MTTNKTKSPCDCLNNCGDDPWLRDGTGRSTPCANLLAAQERDKVAGVRVRRLTELRTIYGAANVFDLVEKMHTELQAARNAAFNEAARANQVIEKFEQLAAPSTIGFNGLTEAETDESMSVRGLSQKAAPSTSPTTNWRELALWWESGAEQWDGLKEIVIRMLAAPSSSPLAYERIMKIANKYMQYSEGADAIPDGFIEDFVRAIEAAHGIKGGA